jgi:hypothetical protein
MAFPLVKHHDEHKKKIISQKNPHANIPLHDDYGVLG